MMARKFPPLEVIDGGQDDRDDPFSLTDYIQLAALGRRSVVVSVHEDGVSGEIVIRDGEAWFAKDGAGEGEGAFRRLLIDGGFKSKAPPRVRPLRAGVVPRNIHVSLESLLLDTARRWDERDEASEAVGLAHPRDAHFEAFFDEGIEALLRKDYSEAYVAFSAARDLRPGDQTVLANLERLAALGVGAANEGGDT